MRSNFINLVKIDVHVDKTDLHVCTKCHADSASKSCCQKVVFFLNKTFNIYILMPILTTYQRNRSEILNKSGP